MKTVTAKGSKALETCQWFLPIVEELPFDCKNCFRLDGEVYTEGNVVKKTTCKMRQKKSQQQMQVLRGGDS